jgi:4-diphosphocytidyl-2-C-methyl-D-erythritol kinase
LTGPFGLALASETDNLILRAARALAQSGGVPARAHLILDKRLPIASGIGGGSADAAAALRLLNRLWRLDAAITDLIPIAATLGADVPACLIGQSLRGTGVGTQMQPIAHPRLSGRPLLLANPGVPVMTGAVFARWDGVDRGAMPPGDDGDAWLHGRNDLEAAAIATAPAIAPLLALLRERQPLARMSGSGATCFALYDDEAARDAAQAEVIAAFPRAWTMASNVA